MDTKTKDGSQSSSDRGSDIDSKDIEIGTIKELLAEINLECTTENGTAVDLKSLGTTLDFIGKFTGREYTSITELLPPSVLKIVKLLYLKNDESGIQLFQYIMAPQWGATPTMEFRITSVAPRNEYRVQLVNELLDQLSTDIGDIRLRQIEASLLTELNLLDCIEMENREILNPVYNLHNNNESAIVCALGHFTNFILRLSVDHTTSTAPLGEVIYTYLRTLPFLHFVGAYKELLSTSKLSDTTKPILSEINAFCTKLGTTHHAEIHAYTPVTSIEEFPVFFGTHVSDFIKLVNAATGISTQRRDLVDKLGYASKVLHMYVFHQNGRTPQHDRLLSVSDCVAALCTIRHQLEVKTNYNASWHGQISKEIRNGLFNQMEKKLDIQELYDSDYIPHGINQLLYSRFCQFHAQFTGEIDRHEAFQAFQIARLDKYAECLLLCDINNINVTIDKLNHHCEQYAQLLVHPVFQASFTERMESWLNRNSI